jgi:hypothetical protein
MYLANMPLTQDARLEGRASVVVLWMITPLPAEREPIIRSQRF